jgi:TonB-dependent receptor
VRQDAVLEAFSEAIVVSASPILEGQAAALNRQRNAINITNIVAADQIGRFPDKNTAEATQRIPSITLLRDQGEGRYVIIRGTEPRLNSTTVNGERIPSPEAGIRDIALDVIPADLLESIKVNKALTPDMDGDAIGGSVNLITKRAPENMRVSAVAAGGYNELTEDNIWNGNFTFGQRYNEKKTGILLSGSALTTDRGSDNFEPEYDDGFLDELQLRDYTIKRERYGATLSIDHRASDRNDFFVRGLWNNFQDTEIRRAWRQKVGDEELVREVKDRLQESDIYSVTAGGNYQKHTSLFSYRVAWNNSSETTPNQVTSAFEQGDVLFDPNVAPGSIDPNNIRANPLNQDFSEYFFDAIETEFKDSDNEDLVAALDYTKGFYREGGRSGLWKVGGKARFKEKDQDVNVSEFGADDDLPFIPFLSTWTSETPFFKGRYIIAPFQSPGLMRDLLASGALEGEKILEEDLADFTSSEDTLAAYGMTEIAFGPKTTFLGGLRVENTETDFNAFELAFDEEGDPLELTPVTGGKDYTEWLPMFHLRYQTDPKSNLRAAITRTLARPNFEDMAPFQLTNFEDEEIERGNPDLVPTTAWNLDLLYERYLEPVGVFSAGIFYKDLKDNIYFSTFDEEFAGTEFEVTQPVNGDDAELTGIEVAYQNRFSKLPSPWDGLGLFFNYTFTDSEADYSFRSSSRLQGQAEQVGNLALSYEKFGFSGVISANYNSKYILEVAEEAIEDLWLDEHLQIDFRARYQFSDAWSLFLELVNLTDEPYRVYEGVSDRTRQEELYGWWGTFGFRWDK